MSGSAPTTPRRRLRAAHEAGGDPPALRRDGGEAGRPCRLPPARAADVLSGIASKVRTRASGRPRGARRPAKAIDRNPIYATNGALRSQSRRLPYAARHAAECRPGMPQAPAPGGPLAARSRRRRRARPQALLAALPLMLGLLASGCSETESITDYIDDVTGYIEGDEEIFGDDVVPDADEEFRSLHEVPSEAPEVSSTEEIDSLRRGLVADRQEGAAHGRGDPRAHRAGRARAAGRANDGDAPRPPRSAARAARRERRPVVDGAPPRRAADEAERVAPSCLSRCVSPSRGLGTVGCGVLSLLRDNATLLAQRDGPAHRGGRGFGARQGQEAGDRARRAGLAGRRQGARRAPCRRRGGRADRRVGGDRPRAFRGGAGQRQAPRPPPTRPCSPITARGLADTARRTQRHLRLRGGGGRRHPHRQGAARGARRQPDRRRLRNPERHLQLHHDGDARIGCGPARRGSSTPCSPRRSGSATRRPIPRPTSTGSTRPTSSRS